ncbi:MAG: glycosyltransferase [Planctomycetota bacterium]
MSITLCVCTYNRGGRIVETLGSVADSGTERLDELLVIDNNSSDDTPDAVRSFAAGHPSLPVRMVRETEQGLTHARARAMRENRSELFAFIDDDVLLGPGWIDATVARFDRSDRIGAVGGIVEIRWESGPTRLAYQRRDHLARQHLGAEPRLMDGERDGLAGAALALRASAVRASGWPENAVLSDRVGNKTSSAGDYEIVARVRLAGYETWYEPGARCEHLVEASRQTEAYLLRLGEGIAASAPWFDWVCAGEPTGRAGIEWARSEMDSTRRKLRRTRLLEVRPKRRKFRIREREAIVRAYEELIDRLEREMRTG